MKVVVTGASGHLGSYVVARLGEDGHEVVAASRSGRLPPLPFDCAQRRGRTRPLALDVCEDACVPILHSELGPEVALVHLAAWHPPSTANTGPAERDMLLATNVYGTMRVLEAAGRAHGGVRCVVYASTFEVYAELEGVGTELTESARLAPRTDYGATKLSGEDHLLAFASEEETRVVALRLPAIYGPGELTSRALPNFLRAVARGERPAVLGDGGDLRDQVHARDAAVAFLQAITGQAEGVFNIADGASHSITELAGVALEVAGMTGPPEFLPRVKPRCDYHLSVARARKELGFTPSVTLRTGMAEELAWMLSSAQSSV